MTRAQQPVRRGNAPSPLMRLIAPGRAGNRASGVTLVEMLVVLAIIGFFLLISIPAIANYIRAAKVRTAVDTFAQDMATARTVAVTTRQTRTVTLASAVPTTGYSYVDVRGRTISRTMPDGVTIDTATNFPVVFTSLGGLSGSPATCTVRGRITPSKSHLYTLSVALTGKVDKTWDFNQP